MKIEFVRGKSLFASQEAILHSLLLKLKVPAKASSRTPGTPGFIHTKSDCPQNDEERAQLVEEGKTPEVYKIAVATLNYPACWWRPEMTYKVNKLPKFVRDPGRRHWQELDKLLAYVNRTKAWGVLFGARDQELNTGLACMATLTLLIMTARTPARLPLDTFTGSSVTSFRGAASYTPT